ALAASPAMSASATAAPSRASVAAMAPPSPPPAPSTSAVRPLSFRSIGPASFPSCAGREVTAHTLGNDMSLPPVGLFGEAGHVGRQEQIGDAVEMAGGGQRLLLEDVDGRAGEAAFPQRRHQRRLVHDPAPGGIDEVGTLL